MTESIGVNTWLSKTFCKHLALDHNMSCEEYLREIEEFARKHIDVLRRGLEVLRGPHRSRVVDELRHYCGWEPRWYTIVIDQRGVYVEGGNVWVMQLDLETQTFETDGCFAEKDMERVLLGLIELAEHGYTCDNKFIEAYWCEEKR